MLERLRTQIGTAGLIVAIVALVAALAGGAIAATGGSGDGKATTSAKGKQGPRGKTGKTGPAGPAGPAGPQGPAGTNGKDGAAGANGAAGTSVSSTPVPTNVASECANQGGAKFTAGSGAPTFACNGKAGNVGPQGPPGPTCNEEGECLLPAGATETGNWGMSSQGVTEIFTPISYPLRLNPGEPNLSLNFHYVSVEDGVSPETAAACPGTAQNPEAEPGQVCVYEKSKFNVKTPPDGNTFTSDETSGLLLRFDPVDVEEESDAVGSWAVTAGN